MKTWTQAPAADRLLCIKSWFAHFITPCSISKVNSKTVLLSPKLVSFRGFPCGPVGVVHGASIRPCPCAFCGFVSSTNPKLFTCRLHFGQVVKEHSCFMCCNRSKMASSVITELLSRRPGQVLGVPVVAVLAVLLPLLRAGGSAGRPWNIVIYKDL